MRTQNVLSALASSRVEEPLTSWEEVGPEGALLQWGAGAEVSWVVRVSPRGAT